ncbi:hypothetical protein GW781_02965 [bacterium]|nr:hypothetical protein [bacterium]NCT20097.1 hypothetical protein [bacterium]OIO86992.1 MAG: hypothetical protein AUK01_01375 [Anaerolineae bacterium CG2_30_57_67]
MKPVFEMVGYAGSLLVAVSLMMKSIVRLRVINLLGALIFVTYGLLIRAYPVALMNALIVGIDLYYLAQAWRQKDFFSLLKISPADEYLRRFLEFYQPEITRFLPEFRAPQDENILALFVLRNMVPAGLFLVRQEGETGQILLDFVIPGYRDFEIGRFLFRQNAWFFRKQGLQQMVSTPGSAEHSAYLRRMGFKSQADGRFTRRIEV